MHRLVEDFSSEKYITKDRWRMRHEVCFMECKWNPCLREKGFVDVFQELDADVFCIQESKLQAGQLELDMPGYHQYWNYAVKKGYSGTAIFTKKEPLLVYLMALGLRSMTRKAE